MAECREAVSLFVSLHRPTFLSWTTYDYWSRRLLYQLTSHRFTLFDIEVIAEQQGVLGASTLPLDPPRVLSLNRESDWLGPPPILE